MGFVRGTIGVCSRCGGELNVRYHLRNVVAEPDHVHYHVAHPCGFQGDLVVDRSIHKSTVAFFKQVRDGMRDDGPPVSEDETLLSVFRSQLKTIKTVEDVEHAIGRSDPGF